MLKIYQLKNEHFIKDEWKIFRFNKSFLEKFLFLSTLFVLIVHILSFIYFNSSYFHLSPSCVYIFVNSKRIGGIGLNEATKYESLRKVRRFMRFFCLKRR